MTKNLQIKWKIVLPIAIVSILGAFGSYLYTSNIYEESEIRSYLNKARTITIAADGARDFTAIQNMSKVFKDSLTNVEDILKTVPIVAAMELASLKADELGFEFKVPAESFRNPDNAPDEFEANILKQLRAKMAVNSDDNSMYEIYTDKNGIDKLRFFKGITLSEDCMACHGEPSLSQVYWGNDKGLDPTGAKLENMKVGFMKGAFEVTMDMSPVYARVNEASTKILGISLSVGLLILIISILVANSITKPINKLSEAAIKISNGNLNDPIDFKRQDEVGKLGGSFEKVRTNLLSIISQGSELSNHIIHGRLSEKTDSSKQSGSYADLLNGMNTIAKANNNVLDKATNVMVADDTGVIRHMNENLVKLLTDNQDGIRKTIPSFDVKKLIGTNIDTFHKNPSYNRGVLDKIQGTHTAVISLGKLAFKLAISPIHDDNGDRSSFVVVWDNYTYDKIFQDELISVIDKIKTGQLDRRMTVELLNDTFAGTGKSINEMLDGIVNPFKITSNYLNDISLGKMPNEITEAYQGEYDTIKQNINKLISTLNSFISDMSNMSKKHDEGLISVLMDENAFLGAYKEMASGVNEMVNGHINVKKKAIRVVQEFGNGNFDADIEKLPGEKAFINEALDLVRDNLKSFQSEVQLLIDSAKNGELENRGQAGKFKGEWSELVSGLNQILEAITEPIDESSIVLSKMSGGDFTVRMNGEYKGEFNTLKNNINLLVESLSSLLFQLQESINTTAATAAELSSTSESMASASAEQSAQTDEVASAVEEMSHTISENARSSIKTSEVATNNGDSAREGGEIVKETIKKMKDIADVVSNSAVTVGELGESSKEIGEIVSVIDDIAEQTNMLALNAAIEAARAGEQGRGFAVVADEVRKLAERTSEATKRISKMISGIQIKTGEAVDAMNKGNKEVDMGIKLADNAGVSLNNILLNAKEVLDMINQIAAASEEQSATSEEISKNVASISQVTSEYSRKVQDISYSAEDLSKLTNDLEVIVGKFKFEKTSGNKALDVSNGDVHNKKLLN
ncbi:methyl-accepting chemotaxis protein [Candidatus Kapabacteria bacterium]|nr:methyl-accepting chemotaxis protein [Candidatus Kapabacteria bacterium]